MKAFDTLEAQLGPGPAPLRWFVPGRIEVLGKHTDYAGGRSLLCAVDRGIAIAARPRADEIIRIVDVARATGCQLTMTRDLEVPASGWPVYPTVVARRLANDFPGTHTGADVAFASDLPPAAGLSSSSALVVAIFAVLGTVNDVAARDEYVANIRSLEDLAGYLGCVENGLPFGTLTGGGGVGTFGGSEDHTAILASEAGRLKQYSFCPVRWERTIPVPAGCVFVVGASGVVAEKTGAARARYNRASEATRRILEIWRAASGTDAPTLAAAVRATPDTAAEIRDVLRRLRDDDASSLVDRFDQFVLESEEIVPRASEAVSRHDLARFGDLVAESQEAAETLLGNQVPETAWLVREARSLGAAAASAFGAGFGGSVWALVDAGEADRFMNRWRGAYLRSAFKASQRSEFFVTAAGRPMTRV